MSPSPRLAQPRQPKIIIAMPAYNEERYIGTMVLKARQYADEVIVLDDGSTDDTTKVAKLAGATVVRHKYNKGYGAAIQSILSEAKKRLPDALVLLDADAQHNLEDIPALIQPISKGFDLVIGSRQMHRNKIPLYRRIGQKVLLHSTHLLSGKRLTDSESGFRVFSKKAVTELELGESGMSVSAETIAAATEKGLKITEVPISITYTKDSSTLNPIRHGFGVLGRIIAMISERRPLFFFGFLGLILTVFGLLAGTRVLYLSTTTEGIATGTALISVLLLTIGVFSIFTGIILNILKNIMKK